MSRTCLLDHGDGHVMRFIVYILIIAALVGWVILKRKRMSSDERRLNEWLHEHGLVCYDEDPFDLISVFEKCRWPMSLETVYKVIEIKHKVITFYLFSGNYRMSERVYRTYGCIMAEIPKHEAVFLFSKKREDLDQIAGQANLDKIEYTSRKHLDNLFSLYGEDPEDAQEVVSLLENILPDLASKDLIIEICGSTLLILSDEYFTVSDIQDSIALARGVIMALNKK